MAEKTTARAFDVRTVIGALLGVYGILLLALGAFATSAEELERADGVNLNLWAGAGLLAAALLFLLWVRLRPLVVPRTAAPEATAEGAEGGQRPRGDAR